MMQPALTVPKVAASGRTVHRRTLRRRRLAARWLAILLVAMAVVLLAPKMVRVLAGPAGGPPAEQVVVQAGDTLWTIAAARTGPSTDVRETVQRIRDFNRLAGSTIHPGQVLLVPAG